MAGGGGGAEFDGDATGGHWSSHELQYINNNINYLELLTIYLGMKCFLKLLCGKHVKKCSDNATAVAYINNFGGTKSVICNAIATDIWTLAYDNDVWCTCLPGIDNITADRESRLVHDETEWMLNKTIFQKIINLGNGHSIDLFASRLNFQLEMFVSWKADPLASHIDVLTLCWTDLNFYAFPPFSLADKVCQKIIADKAEGFVVAPYWTTQSWFPQLMRLCRKPPYLIKQGKKVLVLAHNQELVHPLYRKLNLLVCPVSGRCLRNKVFPKELFQSF